MIRWEPLLANMLQHNHKVHVYYRDVDQMGIVYYARYFEYFEEARTELLRSIDLDVRKIENDGYFLPVVSCSCEYNKSAKFDDELIIITKINEIPRSTLKIEYEVYNSEKVKLVTGFTVHSFLNSQGRAARPPKEILVKIKEQLK
jgi:acyl-CoA thioester hydrolase